MFQVVRKPSEPIRDHPRWPCPLRVVSVILSATHIVRKSIPELLEVSGQIHRKTDMILGSKKHSLLSASFDRTETSEAFQKHLVSSLEKTLDAGLFIQNLEKKTRRRCVNVRCRGAGEPLLHRGGGLLATLWVHLEGSRHGHLQVGLCPRFPSTQFSGLEQSQGQP